MRTNAKANGPEKGAWVRSSVIVFAGAVLVLCGFTPLDRIAEQTVVSDGHLEFWPLGLLMMCLRSVAGVCGLLLVCLRHRPLALARLALVAGAVCVTLMTAEAALHLFYPARGEEGGWRSRAAGEETNQFGFRGVPVEYAPGDFVVVLLGDSQVEADACSFGWMPERRLQFHLGELWPGQAVKVFSLGASGYGQDQQLLVFQEYCKTERADVILLWQTFGNDVWNNVFPTHWPTNGPPKPTYRLVDGELVGPNVLMGQTMRQKSVCRIADLVYNALFWESDLDGAWERYLPPPYKPLDAYDGKVSDEWMAEWDDETDMVGLENIRNEKSHWAVWFSPKSPRTQYGLDLTRCLMEQIRGLATEEGSRFAVFHTSFSPEQVPQDETAYRTGEKLYVKSFLQRERNRAYVNEGFEVFEVPVTLDEWEAGPADGHLNEHAVDQVMRDLAADLAERFPGGGTTGAARGTSP